MSEHNQRPNWKRLAAVVSWLAVVPGCDVATDLDALEVADSEGDDAAIEFRYVNPHLTKPNLLTSMRNDYHGYNAGCWDTAPGGSATFQQYTCHGKDNQRWIFDRQPDGSYLIKPETNQGLCVDIPWGNAVTSQNLQLYPCHGDENQRWNVVAEANASASIRPAAAPNLCLSVEGAVQNAQAPLELATCLGYDFQRWRFSAYNGEDTSMDCDGGVKFNAVGASQYLWPGDRKNFVAANNEMKCWDGPFNFDYASCASWAEYYVVDRPAGSDDVDVRCFNIQ